MFALLKFQFCIGSKLHLPAGEVPQYFFGAAADGKNPRFPEDALYPG
jgi:hypothetical protein